MKRIPAPHGESVVCSIDVVCCGPSKRGARLWANRQKRYLASTPPPPSSTPLYLIWRSSPSVIIPASNPFHIHKAKTSIPSSNMSSTREQGITGSTNPEGQVPAAGQPDDSDISHLKSFENVAGPIKLWLVVRTDLGMSLGKTSSEYLSSQLFIGISADKKKPSALMPQSSATRQPPK